MGRLWKCFDCNEEFYLTNDDIEEIYCKKCRKKYLKEEYKEKTEKEKTDIWRYNGI